MRPSRRRSALLAAAVAASVLAGCSQEEPPAPVAQESPSPSPSPAPNIGATFRDAASTTDGEGSSRYSLTTTTTVNGADVVFSGAGIFDWSTDTGQTVYEVPGGRILQRLLGPDLYLALPQQPDSFFKLSTAEVASSPVGGTVDPSAQLHLLAAVAEAEVVGEQEVRGEATTHYRGRYDVARALKGARGVQQPALRSLLGVAASARQAEYDVYLDEDNRLRRLTQTVETPSAGQTLTVTTTLELYDFGIDVTVIAPPAAVVRDGAPLLAALRAALPKPTAAASPAPTPAASVAPTPAASVAPTPAASVAPTPAG